MVSEDQDLISSCFSFFLMRRGLIYEQRLHGLSIHTHEIDVIDPFYPFLVINALSERAHFVYTRRFVAFPAYALHFPAFHMRS